MNTKICYLFASIIMLCVACDPVEDRDKPGRILNSDELVFDLIQEPAGSNTIIFDNKTPEIIPYYDWGTGFSNKPRTEAYFPFAGDYTVTFTAYCAGGSVSTTRNFTVSRNDPEYFKDPAWNKISGNGAGKVWIFATDIPTDNYDGRIWGNGGYKGNPPGPSWWGRTAADAKDDNIDIGAEMYFDLDGGANFKVTNHGTVSSGSYDLKLDEKVMSDDGQVWSIGSIELAGATIPHGISQNEGKKPVYKFDICILTEDELVLSYNTGNNKGSGSESWFWRFKRKGFDY